MGYFPNGSAQVAFQETYCDKCVHDKGRDCPVLLLHLLWNYDAVGVNKDETKETALNVLIPQTEDGLGNDQCKMFVEA